MKNNQNLVMNFSYKDINDGWGGGSDTKSACCFSREHESSIASTHIREVMPPVIPAPLDPTTVYEFRGHPNTCCRNSQRYTYIHTHKNELTPILKVVDEKLKS